MNLFIFVFYHDTDENMQNKAYQIFLAGGMLLLELVAVVLMFMYFVATDYKQYQSNILIIAFWFPANIMHYLLLSSLGTLTAKIKRNFSILVVLSILAGLEYFFFGNNTKYVFNILAMIANIFIFFKNKEATHFLQSVFTKKNSNNN